MSLQSDPLFYSSWETSAAPHVPTATVSSRLRLRHEMEWEGGRDRQGGKGGRWAIDRETEREREIQSKAAIQSNEQTGFLIAPQLVS